MGCVLITGAAGGIGKALVKAFAGAGYAVIGVDRMGEPEGLAVERFVQCDLARTVEDRSYADAICAEIRALFGGRGLHALVNNAAVQILGGVEKLDREGWRSTLDVNLLAPFFWTQAFLPELEAAKGCVLNISSIHARLTKRDFVAYATSKAALSGLTRAMAVDLGGRVRINAIEPAAIATDMLRQGFAGREQAFARLEDCHPQGRIGSAEEVASLALAISDGSLGFVHGACLSVDGGISGRLHDPT